MNSSASRKHASTADARHTASAQPPTTTFEQLQIARDILRQNATALQQLSTKLPADFGAAVDLVARCAGCVIVTGVGKAGWIGQKLSATFASTGTRSHFLHPAEAIHGDLGRVGSQDIVLVLSNSGETTEIVTLLPSFQKLGTPVVALTAATTSTLAVASDVVLEYGKTSEACHLGLAPSTTTMLMLAIGDALALVVSRLKEFQATDFAQFHPGGSLGRRLALVEQTMRPLDSCRTALENEPVRDIYIRYSGKDRRAGVVLVVDGKGLLSGIFTDSDLAKILERQQDSLLDQPIGQVMTKSPVTIPAGSRTSLAIETFACRNLSELPVIDKLGRPLGLIDITDVVAG